MAGRHTTLYRDKQNSNLMGVCAGIADYTGVNALWVRLGFIAANFATGFMLLLPYFIMGLLLNKKPTELYTDKQEQQYWQGVRQNPRRSAREIRGKMRDIDRRLAEVEAYYVSSNPRLNSEIERLR
ncbi:MAG: envelope stress response membrane protein PspC [Sphingomonadaceae bacterium]